MPNSIRDKNDLVIRKYHTDIKEKAKLTENIIYVNHFMEEKEQDSWIYLSDFVILPYRKISNSGILGRAKLYKKVFNIKSRRIQRSS